MSVIRDKITWNTQPFKFEINFPFFSSISAPVLSDNNSDLDKLKKNITNLLPELSNLPNLPNLPNIPQIDGLPDLSSLDIGNKSAEAKKAFRDKCIKNSGSDAAYEEAEVCINSHRLIERKFYPKIILLASHCYVNGVHEKLSGFWSAERGNWESQAEWRVGHSFQQVST